jgi:hypothetical protein
MIIYITTLYLEYYFNLKEKMMVNKKFWLGILVMVLVFGMSVVGVEAQSNKGGEFTLTNIPGKYDGKYVFLEAEEDSEYMSAFRLIGGDSIEPPKAFRIIDGKVIIPLWITRDGEKLERYSGNHQLRVDVAISDSPEYNNSTTLETVYFMYASPANRKYVGDCRVNFTNGSATKSYNDRNKLKY